MEVKVTNSEWFLKDKFYPVYKIDVEHLGQIKPDPNVTYIHEDEDDEQYKMEMEDKQPVQPVDVVRTWFLLNSPIDGKFHWIDMDDCSMKPQENLYRKHMLKRVKASCLSCKKCNIGGQFVEGYPGNVFSSMRVRAKIMIVGQNPGKEETKIRRPFVGRSGQFFDQMFEEHVGVPRKELYVTNVVKCFTEGNRAPVPSEIKNCFAYLKQEIEIMKPRIIVTLGNFALKALLGNDRTITDCHGKVYETEYGKVFPLLHPSPLNMNKPDKRKLFTEDLKKLKEILK
jgi:DNA polymerase